jgi:MFS transporter, ACS family, hexuronate transporter
MEKAGAAAPGYRWAVLGAATVMQVGFSMAQQTPAAIGPVLISSLHLSSAELGLLTSAIWGGMLLGMIPFGLLVDRYGERRVIVAGGLMLALFLGLASTTRSFLPLFVLLIPAAIGASSCGTRAIAEWFPPGRRGLALGIRQCGVTIAGLSAALFLPGLVLRFGWYSGLWAVAAAALAAGLVFVLAYREPAVERTTRRHRLSPGLLLRNRRLMAGTAFSWIFMGVLGAAVTNVPPVLHGTMHMNVVDAGRFLALLQLGGLVGRISWGMISDRIGSPNLTMGVIGVITTAACAGVGLLAHEGAPLPAVAAVIAVLGFSAMGWNALPITLTSESVPIQHAATAVGATTAVSFTGMFVGAPVFGLIVDHGGYRPAWLALGAWALLGSVLVLTLGRGRARLA